MWAKGEGTRLTAASYNPALKAAAKAGDWMIAISAIDVMTRIALTDKEAGPDVVSFNYAMSACAKAGESEVREPKSQFWVSQKNTVEKGGGSSSKKQKSHL